MNAKDAKQRAPRTPSVTAEKARAGETFQEMAREQAVSTVLPSTPPAPSPFPGTASEVMPHVAIPLASLASLAFILWRPPRDGASSTYL